MINRSRLLRICFTREDTPLETPELAKKYLEIYSARISPSLLEDIADVDPDILCFDFDYPDESQLLLLRKIKEKLPAIPILMMTDYHSEALVLWALRARVWDYFIKPLNPEEFIKSVKKLNRFKNEKELVDSRKLIRPTSPVQYIGRVGVSESIGSSSVRRAVTKAMIYIENNISKKISLKKIAEHCGISPSYLSREFKTISGMTFSDYLLKTRIKLAIKLLSKDDMTVTAVCYDVGFHDLTYFGRIFKRYTGVNPSSYHESVVSKSQECLANSDKQFANINADIDNSTANLRAELFLQRCRGEA